VAQNGHAFRAKLVRLNKGTRDVDKINWWTGVIMGQGLVICLLASFVLFIFFKRSDELDKDAAQNTGATLLVYGANIFVAILFIEDLNAWAQRAYAGLNIPTLAPDFWDDVPLVITCLFGLAAKDFADYWCHRAMHTRWFWPTHAAHHSDTHVNAFTAYRVHALEAVMMSFTYIVLLTWLQMSQAVPLVVLFSFLHVKYVHMNLDWNHGPFKYLIASPAFHRWHHADAPEAYGKNLANIMPIYDLMFGTYYYPGPCRAPMGALSSGMADKNPVAIYLYPFQEWARLIRELFAGKDASETAAPPRKESFPAE